MSKSCFHAFFAYFLRLLFARLLIVDEIRAPRAGGSPSLDGEDEPLIIIPTFSGRRSVPIFPGLASGVTFFFLLQIGEAEFVPADL